MRGSVLVFELPRVSSYHRGGTLPRPLADGFNRAAAFALHRRVCQNPRLPLVTKGSCRRRRLMRSEGRRFVESHPVVRQNVHLLIPSVTASPCHRLAAARSRRGSDSLPGCHSTPRRRFATLVTKGRHGCAAVPSLQKTAGGCIPPAVSHFTNIPSARAPISAPPSHTPSSTLPRSAAHPPSKTHPDSASR